MILIGEFIMSKSDKIATTKQWAIEYEKYYIDLCHLISLGCNMTCAEVRAK
jgi:hypothetical protein